MEKPLGQQWYRLDNAAVIYASALSSKMSTVFRLSVTLKKRINIDILQKALENVIPRFPYFTSRLRTGFFWYYLEQNNKRPKINVETKYPCLKFNKKTEPFLFRVTAFEKRISVEISHILTDGVGGSIFLKALLLEYLALSGIKPDSKKEFDELKNELRENECENAYLNFYKKKIPSPKKSAKAFHIQGKPEQKGVYRNITGIISIDRINKIIKKREVSITEFMTAVYLNSINEIGLKLKNKKPVRIAIPVNLRKLYPSNTIRNFFLSVIPGINPKLGNPDFEEILKIVHHYMQVKVNPKLINQQISRNVKFTLNAFTKRVPLFIKNIIHKYCFHALGSNQYSGTLSNLGKIDFPDPFNKHIERFEFLPNYNPKVKTSCGITGFNGNLYINFGRIIKNAEVERLFFTQLIKMGIPVKIESNYIS